MFSSKFAEISLQDPIPQAPRPKLPALVPTASIPRLQPQRAHGVETFTAEGVITTLDAINGADTSTRSVALKLESELAGKSLSGHEDVALNAALEDWMRITHHVMDYQYVHDMNSYVQAVQNDERTRLNRQYGTIANDVMVKKHMYTMRERDAMKLQSRVRMLMHTMLFVSAFAFLYASRAFFGAAGWFVLSVMSCAFGIYVIMYIKISGTRRYNDWDAMYFNDGEDIKSDTSVDDLANTGKCATTGSVPYTT